MGRQILSALIPSSRVALSRGAGVRKLWRAVVYICVSLRFSGAFTVRDGRKQQSNELTGYLWNHKFDASTVYIQSST